MKKLKQDMVLMLIIMLLSALVYLVFIPSQIKLPAKVNTSFTNRTFPQLTMVVIFAASTLGFADALTKFIKEKKTAAPEEEKGNAKANILSELKPFIGAAIIVAYGLLFKFLSTLVPGYGFIIATVLFIPAFLAYIGCRKWQYYVYVYAFATVMFVVFKFVLHVLLR